MDYNLKYKLKDPLEDSNIAKWSQFDITLIQQLLEIGKVLLAESKIDRFLSIALDIFIQYSNAERGIILLLDERGKILSKIIKTQNDTKKFSDLEIDFSEISNPELHIKPINQDKNSIIYHPFSQGEKTFGVIYLDNYLTNKAFKKATSDFVNAFTDFISLAAYNVLERQRLETQMIALESEIRSKFEFDHIVGRHPDMIKLLKLVSQIADTDAIVLIQGESGTGKELIARALHFNSKRRQHPFIPINCSALSENILESELFGHVRGAFTGAAYEKIGWFERAAGGTVFLDEVSEMSPALQVKLLRILQTGEYSRVGESKIHYANIRTIAATNKSLQTLVQNNKFREDLYYRLNVFDLTVPPLRERRSDIPLISNHFLKIFRNKYNKNNLRFSKDALTILNTYDYPGNCRELEHIIQRTVLLCEKDVITPNQLPEKILHSTTKNLNANGKISSFKAAKQRIVEKFEQDYLIDSLKLSNGNISRAARTAGINIKNFYQKLVKYQIEAKDFKPSLKN